MMIETNDLMTSSQVSEALMVSRAAVSNWKTRPDNGFPKPIIVLSETPLYSRAEVRAWARVRYATLLTFLEQGELR